MRITRIRSILIIAIIAVLLTALFFNRVRIRTLFDDWRAPTLPVAKEFKGTSFEVQNKDKTGGASDNNQKIDDRKWKIETVNQQPTTNNQFPISYNLAVPFQPQAPDANWGLPYQEACEEAALIMASAFFDGQKDLSAPQMDKAIKDLVAWEEKRFGYYQDTTVDEVATIAREYFDLQAELSYDVSVENIKRQIAANKLVLVPAAGKILPNPYFRAPGPLYHMLVIRGYTPNRFITNDPGTKRGRAFTYRYDDLLNSIHDWPRPTGGSKQDVSEAEMLTGKKVMIVIDRG